jgi:hypothetical protein
VCPSSDVPDSVHSRSMLPSSFGSAVPPAPRVPSSRFLTASTACSASQGPSVLQPGAGQGSLRFPTRPPHETPRSEDPETARWRLAVPRSASHTPRRIPLAGSRTTSLRPLPSCRCHAAAPQCRNTSIQDQFDFRALLHRRVRSVSSPLPATPRPILPWASFPYKVPFPRSRVPGHWRAATPVNPSLGSTSLQ